MKKLLDRFHWDDRAKLIAAAAATGAILLLAMLLPLAFRRSAPPAAAPADPALERRVALFTEYWGAGEDDDPVRVEHLEPADAAPWEARFQELVSVWIDDRRLADTEPSGAEYSAISRTGQQMTVCRMWLEKTGDWRNWLDVCFDGESGMLCYLYLSRECLSNRGDYPAPAALNTRYVAEWLAAELNGEVRYLDAQSDTAMTALISTAGGTIGYRIECTVYDRLVDLKVNIF